MNTNMNLQRIPVEKLKPAKYNPRKDLKPGTPPMKKSSGHCPHSAMLTL